MHVTKHIKQLVGEELVKREAQLLQKHDMATNGIMGSMPLVPNMPVKFTAAADEEYGILKNTRGVLLKWQLHSVDVQSL